MRQLNGLQSQACRGLRECSPADVLRNAFTRRLMVCRVPPSQVFLSATLANASEFAGWVAQLHQQPCHVVYTDYRPTPLQHFAFPIGGDGLYMV